LYPKIHTTVPGANAHVLSMVELEALQAIVGELGAISYPLFLRLGAAKLSSLQPVTARAVLAEIERAMPHLAEELIPGVQFLGADGAELGAMFARAGDTPLAADPSSLLDATPDGLRMVVSYLPPPAGFRSRPGLAARQYECFFEEIRLGDAGYVGIRTAAMGGAEYPVTLPPLPLPPVTQWDHARVSGRPIVDRLLFTRRPATEVYQTLLHGLISACNDSVRLKAPLQFRTE
jgi:hypothetical protein